MEGQLVAGRYRLMRLIGKGSVGAVWLARHEALGSYVAVKLILSEIAAEPEAIGRFVREAKVAAQLSSSHVVTVLDLGSGPEGTFMVMEYLPGQDLKQRIKACGALGIPETVTWITHIAHAMAAAHEKGLVHRDLKPANVFLTQYRKGEGVVAKVLDFGVAKAPDILSAPNMDPTRTGALLGTPYYMSPEQAQGLKDIDHTSDIWAMGVLVFECLTGKRPFVAKSLGPLVAQVLAAPIPNIVANARHPVPPALQGWFETALARDRGKRFDSAQMAATALRTAINTG